MRAGRPTLWCLLALAAALVAGGCEQLAPYRQGVRTSYFKELRQLGEEINFKENAKAPNSPEQITVASHVEDDNVEPAPQWHPLPLITAIHLKAPVPEPLQ
jgi:hypothetical protein